MMSNVILITQTLGFAAGAVLFTLLIVLIKRARAASEAPLAAAGGWIWNTGNLALYAGLLAGAAPNSTSARLSNAFAYTGAAVLSTGFFQFAAPEAETERRQKWRKRFLIFSLGIAAVLSMGLFLSVLISGFPVGFNRWRLFCAYNLPFHLIVALLLFRRRSPSPGASQIYRRFMLFMVIALALALMTRLHVQLSPEWEPALRIAAEQSSIPMGLLAIVTFSKFSFADRFVKQSILILTSVLIALLFHGLILQPAIRVVGARSPYPTAAEWVVRILLWAMLLLCFPELKRRLDEIVDRLLFQRPDYRRLTQSFSQLCDQAEDESRVFELTETTIRESLNIPTLRLVAEEAIELHPESSAITPLSADHPLRRHRPELEWFLPLESNGRITEIIALAPGRGARRLLSDELDFLNGLSERAGRRLDALKFENERRERALAMERMQHLLTQAELRALQAQINPHFLFNTLNTIADLIGRSPEKAETLTEQLAEIFRYALQKSGASEVSLKDEIQFLKTYLEIEQTRFGSRLTVDLQIDEDVSEALIPPLLLQPLVENAVKHGIAQSLGGGRLEVRAYRADQELRLSVANDRGDWREGSLTGHSGGHGLGLRNIRERLSALYGPRASLEIASEPGRGTRVLITIPDDETQNIDRGRRGAGEIAPEKTHRRAS